VPTPFTAPGWLRRAIVEFRAGCTWFWDRDSQRRSPNRGYIPPFNSCPAFPPSPREPDLNRVPASPRLRVNQTSTRIHTTDKSLTLKLSAASPVDDAAHPLREFGPAGLSAPDHLQASREDEVILHSGLEVELLIRRLAAAIPQSRRIHVVLGSHPQREKVRQRQPGAE
jgi:hypothetical protein